MLTRSHPLFFVRVQTKKKLNETIERADNAPAPTRLLHVRGW